MSKPRREALFSVGEIVFPKSIDLPEMKVICTEGYMVIVEWLDEKNEVRQAMVNQNMLRRKSSSQ